MSDLNDLIKRFEKWEKDIDNEVMEAQRRTAQQIWEDVIGYAPVKTGEYISSITIDDTIKEKNTISTFIGSDLTVEAKSTDKKYNLGYLLEHGTLPHAIPNAFNWGVIYGFDSEQYARTLRYNWHTGMYANPHYRLALEKNRKLYKDNIRRTWRSR